jgi:fibronectin type 3 domain-containing protein
LSIASSVSTKTIPLSGVATSHQVNLSWNAPSGLVSGFNVYRALSGSTSFARVNSSVDPNTSYTDSTVKSGTSYDYTVKSVDSSGVESAPSNKTTVTIP